MNRTRPFLVSVAAALAAVAGFFALARTLALGQQSHAAQDRQVALRTAQLDRYEASLRNALRRKPPALPPLSKADSAQPGAPVRVVYHRPPPVVVTTHRNGEDEHENEHEVEGAEADD